MPLQIIRQDVTCMQVDAIVNTTNTEMVGYGGVDLAVHTAAGRELDAECARLAPLGVGQATLSGGYNLQAKYIIHTVSPVWRGGAVGEDILLRSCYIECLKLAVENGCRSVAFPLIATGTNGFPKDRVLKFAIRTITDFLFTHEMTVYLCVYDRESYAFSQRLFSDISAFIGDEDADKREEELYADFDIGFIEPCAHIEPDECLSFDGEPPLPPGPPRVHARPRPKATFARGDLRDFIGDMDKSFQEMLFDLIDESGMTDVECYKRANVDKRVFSKIKSNKNYKPSKPTAIAFAIALRLDMDKTQALLATVGFTLSQSTVFDKIIRYFILNRNYDILEINEALFEFDQSLLGSV